MSFENVVPTEILFKSKLHASKYAAIFLVVVRGHKCVMKVVSLLDGAYQLTSLLKYLQHHGRGPRRYYEPEGRELDIHVLECSAYRRLKEHGLCDSGLVPNFLGSMRKFDPHLCQPHLNSFLYDEHLPSAIFLDYIPDLEMINIHNCTEKRLNNLITGVQEIHRALVRHRDPKPRNMMVVRNDPERVVWIDFDRAETYDEGEISDDERRSLREEEEIVVGFAECLVSLRYTTTKIERKY
jgi:serine/threonine protein kinase